MVSVPQKQSFLKVLEQELMGDLDCIVFKSLIAYTCSLFFEPLICNKMALKKLVH